MELDLKKASEEFTGNISVCQVPAHWRKSLSMLGSDGTLRYAERIATEAALMRISAFRERWILGKTPNAYHVGAQSKQRKAERRSASSYRYWYTDEGPNLRIIVNARRRKWNYHEGLTTEPIVSWGRCRICEWSTTITMITPRNYNFWPWILCRKNDGSQFNVVWTRLEDDVLPNKTLTMLAFKINKYNIYIPNKYRLWRSGTAIVAYDKYRIGYMYYEGIHSQRWSGSQ